MRANWSRLLISLGNNVADTNIEVKRLCPVHNGKIPTLIVSMTETGPRYRCEHNECRFNGDGLELMSIVTGIDHLTLAMDMVRGGTRAGIMDSPLSRNQAETWAKLASDQAAVKAWIKRCGARLRSERISLPSIPARMQQWPEELGIMVQDPCVRKRDDVGVDSALIYPFTYDGGITAVLAKLPSEPGFREAVVNTSGGMFMEDNIRGNKGTMLISYNPEIAAIIASKLSGITSRLPSIAGARSAEFPESYLKLSDIVVVTGPDCVVPLPILVALRKLNGPKVWVKEMDRPVSLAQPAELVKMYTDNKGQALNQYLLTFIERCFEMGLDLGPELENYLKKDDAEELAIAAADAGLRLAAKVYARIKCTGADAYKIEGGYVKCGVDFVSWSDGDRSYSNITNFGISVVARELNGDNLDYVTEVTPRLAPPILIRVPRSKLVAQDIVRLAESAYARLNLSPYLYASSSPKYSWPDIMCKLAEDAETRFGVYKLGACYDGTLRFPESKYDVATNTVTKINTEVSGLAARLYDGVMVTSENHNDSYAKLFCNPSNIGLSLAFSHIAVEQARGLYYEARNRAWEPRHLIMVDDDRSWRNTISWLASILNDSEFPAKLEDGKAGIKVNDFGSLPLILDSGSYTRPGQFENLVRKLDVGIITKVDMDVIGKSNDRCTYVTAPNIDLDHNCELESLRRGLAFFLGTAIKAIETDPNLRLSGNPVKLAYSLICTSLNVDPIDISDLCNDTYVDDKNGIKAYLGRLSRRIKTNPTELGTVAKASGADMAKYDIAIGPTYTAIKYGVLVPASLGPALEFDASVQGLSMLRKPPILERRILIKKEAWEHYVTTPSLFAKPSLVRDGADSAACG